MLMMSEPDDGNFDVFARYFYICTDVARFVFIYFLGVKHSLLRVDMIFSLVIFEDLQSLLFLLQECKSHNNLL